VKDIDIKPILDEWPYHPERNIRIARFSDGRLLLQIRLPMGLEQYEIKGRPDGTRPHGCASELAYQLRRLEKAQAGGETAVSFRLDHEACEALFEESTLFYLRYVRLLEMEDWARTLRDTTHNLKIFDLVHHYAEQEEDRDHLEQWRPYLIRVHALAAAMVQLSRERPGKAVQILESAVHQIKALPAMNREPYLSETRRSLAELADLLKRIRDRVPPSPADRLEQELQQAVAKEEYERAAELRDQIQALQDRSSRRATVPAPSRRSPPTRNPRS